MAVMEDFIASLGERADVIKQLLVPFEYLERTCKRPDLETLAKVEIDLGFGFGKKEFLLPKDPVKLAESIDRIKENRGKYIEQLIARDLRKIELTETQCALPNLEKVKEYHKTYPIFGFILGYHGLYCERCGDPDQQEDHGYAVLEEAEANIANMSAEEQAEFVALGSHIVGVIFETPGEWEDALVAAHEAIEEAKLAEHEREIETGDRELLEIATMAWNIDGPFMALHHWKTCPLADAVTENILLWYLKHPFFLTDGLLTHVASCDQLRETCRQFEDTVVNALPYHVRMDYQVTRKWLTEGRESFFGE